MNTQAPTVLVVSDDRSCVRQLSTFLDLFGYVVRQAVDVRLALSAVEAAQPDLVIVDWGLPANGSLELCRAVCAPDTANDVYVLVIYDKLEPAALIQALEVGADDFLAKPIVYGELLARLRAGSRVLDALQCQRRGLLADATTGLPTQTAFVEYLRRRLSGERRGSGACSCVAIDVDYLENVNRNHGRPAGNTVLKAVADELRARCREEDYVARAGDDEFVVFLGDASEHDAAQWAQSARRDLENLEITWAGTKLGVTGSFGVVQCPREAASPAALVQAAQAVLETAKRSGRNCVVRDGEFESETRAWREAASPDRMFDHTVVRDVMVPCPVLLTAEDDLCYSAALVERAGLELVPVVDTTGQLVGALAADDLTTAPEDNAASDRRVADVAQTAITSFEESTEFRSLFDFFVAGDAPAVIAVHEGRPTGVITRDRMVELVEPFGAAAEDEAKPVGAVD